jgi:hypothetical protein
MVVGYDRLARQRLDDRAGERFGHSQYLAAGVKCTRADQHHHLLSGIEHLGRGSHVLGPRHPRCGEENGRCGLYHRRGRRRIGIGIGVGHLDVGGDREVRYGPAGQRVANGQIDQGRDLHRPVDHLVVLGHIHVELLERHLLLIAGPEHLGFLHAGDGQYRCMVELGVVQTVQ